VDFAHVLSPNRANDVIAETAGLLMELNRLDIHLLANDPPQLIVRRGAVTGRLDAERCANWTPPQAGDRTLAANTPRVKSRLESADSQKSIPHHTSTRVRRPIRTR